MTATANRSPKFVVMDRDGLLMSGPRDEESSREVALRLDREDPDDAPHGVHPIGPALPAPAAKSLGEVAADAWDRHGPYEARWSYVASAVIAAHEAGRGEPERVVRWAVRGKEGGWFGSDFCDAHKTDRTLFADRDYAADIARTFVGARLVRITTRRRRAAP